MKSQFDRILKKAEEIALEASDILKNGHNLPLNIKHKGEVNLVTEMDKRSEELITGRLQEYFPNHGIVAEEGTSIDHNSGFVWYVDPLDGTTNYAHKLPWYAVSMGLFLDGRPLLGVVANPANGQIFTGISGKGAFLNGKPIRVSEQDRLIDCLVVTGFPYDSRKNSKKIFSKLEKFLALTRGIRRFGAAALDLCYVAAGCYQGYWERGLKPWDTAAGILILQEAGGMVSTYEGNPYAIFEDTILASNGKIHQQMLQVLETDLKEE